MSRPGSNPHAYPDPNPNPNPHPTPNPHPAPSPTPNLVGRTEQEQEAARLERYQAVLKAGLSMHAAEGEAGVELAERTLTLTPTPTLTRTRTRTRTRTEPEPELNPSLSPSPNQVELAERDAAEAAAAANQPLYKTQQHFFKDRRRPSSSLLPARSLLWLCLLWLCLLWPCLLWPFLLWPCLLWLYSPWQALLPTLQRPHNPALELEGILAAR